VEIFLAARDPSGFGEGKTFLGSVTSGSDGAFTTTFPEVRNCESLTATATDGEGNTSAFAQNRTVGVCVARPSVPVTAVILILGAAGGSAFLPNIQFAPLRLRGALRRLMGGLVGFAAGGAMVGILALILGKAPVRAGEVSFPPCSDFLNENLTRPASGAAFELGADVVIELSPQPDPPGSQTQWRIEVSDFRSDWREATRAIPSLRLSELGFNPQIQGEYFWRAVGERLAPDGQTWEVFCRDAGPREFSILQPAPTETVQLPTSTPTPTETQMPTPTLPPPAPLATFLQNANCREGPALVYDIVTSLYQGQTADVEGRNVEGTWWWILLPGLQAHCWVAGSTVQVSGDIAAVPVFEAPPTPPPGCWVWNPQTQQNVCTSPCPANAQPGGACTP
jgi:hypothetical protein